jgi:hypothetical protein
MARWGDEQERVTMTDEEEFEAKLVEIGTRYIRAEYIAKAIFDLACMIRDRFPKRRLEFDDMPEDVIESWMKGYALDHPAYAVPGMMH